VADTLFVVVARGGLLTPSQLMLAGAPAVVPVLTAGNAAGALRMGARASPRPHAGLTRGA